MQKLPIGIHTFERLRNENRLYIDKTEYIYDLITAGSVYFLSRPRRFGKSLLVSTLASLFEGRRDLFEGLWIAEQTDYPFEAYAVLQFDFTKDKFKSPEQLKAYLTHRIDTLAKQFQIELQYPNYAGRFAELIEKIGQKQRVVILIDEYDKPLLDNFDNPQLDEMKETLKGFYGVIKGSDAHLRFVLLTGVTKFARVSIFSDLNNLLDISMDIRYAELLGITQTELEYYFADRIDQLSKALNLSQDELLDRIKIWYNGYRFSTKASYVYNPFSTLILFEQQQFKPYWFETGTPTFLINLIKKNRISFHKLYEDVKVSERNFATYRLEKLAPLPLLFQTGYLTIKDVYESDFNRRYSLNYPNFEVKHAFLFSLLDEFSNLELSGEGYLDEMIDCLRTGDMEGMFEYLQVFFATVPHDLHLKNEKYYQTIFYSVFQLIGLRIEAEVKTNKGRIDAVVETADRIYIFEFKLFGTAEEALSQIKEKQYAQKYLKRGKEILLLGVEFDQTEKNIGKWLVETVKNEE
ncbi:ATP-binding protein [Anaerolineales bacterium HSG6]|nr:ATP-binding protein [Anaerolineales bacterium HSG6]